ncbi:MAG: PAS domain S-box protein [Chloroflexota bacterium]
MSAYSYNGRTVLLRAIVSGVILINLFALIQIGVVLGLSLQLRMFIIPTFVGLIVGWWGGTIFGKLDSRAAEQREAAERLKAVVDTAVDGIITIDEWGTIETLNPAAAKIFGYESDKMLGQNVTMLMPSPYHEEHDGYLSHYRRTGERKIIGIGREVEGLRKDGSIFPLELAVSETNVNDHRFFTGIVRDITERRIAEQAIRESEVAIDAERNRIARDLHDSVTQTLFAASMIADVLPIMWETKPAMAHDRLQELRELSRGALAEMRTLLLELRPAALVDAELDQLLQQLADATLGRYRIPVELNMIGDVNALPSEWWIAIYRIVQEALNNAGKHANASQVSIHIQNDGQGFNLTIQDNGCGFDQNEVKGGHFGLANMIERAEAIGATLKIESQPNQGTMIRVEMDESIG